MDIDFSQVPHPPHGHPEHDCVRYMHALMALVGDQMAAGLTRDASELWIVHGPAEDLRTALHDPDGFAQWAATQQHAPDCPMARAAQARYN